MSLGLPIFAQRGGMRLVPNEKNELVPMRSVTVWKDFTDYLKLITCTNVDRLARKGWY